MYGQLASCILYACRTSGAAENQSDVNLDSELLFIGCVPPCGLFQGGEETDESEASENDEVSGALLGQRMMVVVAADERDCR